MSGDKARRRLGRLHLTLTLAWSALILPTVLLWANSVPWIGLMSIYAIIVSHASAWQATRAEKEASNNGS